MIQLLDKGMIYGEYRTSLFKIRKGLCGAERLAKILQQAKALFMSVYIKLNNSLNYLL